MPVTNFFWDGDNLLQEYDDTGTTNSQYSTEPTSFGNITSQRRGAQSHYYHYDPRGSTTELTNASGDVTDTRRYRAFGATVEQSGNAVFPFQFAGRVGYYYDPERGTSYVRRRDLDTIRGRWLANEPLPQRILEGYLYVHNSPMGVLDPLGLIFCRYTLVSLSGFIIKLIEGVAPEWLEKEVYLPPLLPLTLRELLQTYGKKLGSVDAILTQKTMDCPRPFDPLDPCPKPKPLDQCCQIRDLFVKIRGAKLLIVGPFELSVTVFANKGDKPAPYDDCPNLCNDEIIEFVVDYTIRVKGAIADIGGGAEVADQYSYKVRCMKKCKDEVQEGAIDKDKESPIP